MFIDPYVYMWRSACTVRSEHHGGRFPTGVGTTGTCKRRVNRADLILGVWVICGAEGPATQPLV